MPSASSSNAEMQKNYLYQTRPVSSSGSDSQSDAEVEKTLFQTSSDTSNKQEFSSSIDSLNDLCGRLENTHLKEQSDVVMSTGDMEDDMKAMDETLINIGTLAEDETIVENGKLVDIGSKNEDGAMSDLSVLAEDNKVERISQDRSSSPEFISSFESSPSPSKLTVSNDCAGQMHKATEGALELGGLDSEKLRDDEKYDDGLRLDGSDEIKEQTTIEEECLESKDLTAEKEPLAHHNLNSSEVISEDMLDLFDSKCASFVQEAAKRSDEVMEDGEVNELELGHGCNEDILAYGGMMPKNFRIQQEKPTNLPQQALTSMPSNTVPPSNSPTNSTYSQLSSIENESSIEMYRNHPKEFFIGNLSRFLGVHPLPDDAHAVATSFARKMIAVYKNTDDLRSSCFLHMFHMDMTRYTAALYFLSTAQSSPHYGLYENAFIRGSNLQEAIDQCPTCQLME